MPSEVVGLIGIGALLVLLVAGLPIALAVALTGFLGLWYLVGLTAALSVMGTIPFSEISTYALTVLPLFIMGGFFCFEAGLATQAFETAKRWVGHIPGSLGMALIVAQTVFGACSGISTAAVALFAKISMPEMEKMGYKPGFAAALIAATGTIDALIPPAAGMVIYAFLAEVSVGKMLIGGIFPGLLTALMYGIMIYLRIRRDPSLVGDRSTLKYTWRERLGSLPSVWPVFLVAGVIIVGIYGGVFTPTEAGAITAIVGTILLFTRRGISRWAAFSRSVSDTGRICAMIVLIIVGANVFSNFAIQSRMALVLGNWVGTLEINRYIILAILMIFGLVLGSFFDPLSMLLISLPIVLPISQKLGFDGIWFGVIMIKNLEMGCLTPPMAENIFVVKSVLPHVPLMVMYRAIIPFLLTDLITLTLLIAFPQIVLFLPSRMAG